MYDRTINKQVLTFTVSGKLWGDSLVMADLETKTLWSHILGEAQEGKLKGTMLKVHPSYMVGWGKWKTRHPQTTVVELSRTARRFRTRDFMDNPQMLIGLAENGLARAWFFGGALSNLLQNDRLGDRAVLFALNRKRGIAVLFGRKVGDRELNFEWFGEQLIDKETRSHWNLLTGKATVGPLKGKQLTELPGIVSFSNAWAKFHPKSSYYRVPLTGQPEPH